MLYETYYHLSMDPFRPGPEARFFFEHRGYARAKAYLQYALLRRDGITLLTGAAGTGKTTLCNDLVAHLKSHEVATTQIIAAGMPADDFLRTLGYALGLEVMGIDKATLVQRLKVFLLAQAEGGGQPLLIIDEAQELDASALNEVRLLDNLRVDGQSLLPVVLVGQEQLRQRLYLPSLTHVQQRLVAACHLEPLNGEETSAYVHHRLRTAHWHGNPELSEAALRAIHEFALGIPRRINLLCGRLLLHGSLEQKSLLQQQDVQLVVEALRHEGLIAPISADLREGPAAGRSWQPTMPVDRPSPHAEDALPDTLESAKDRHDSASQLSSIPRAPPLDAGQLEEEPWPKPISATQLDEPLVSTLPEMVATRPSTRSLPGKPRSGIRRHGIRVGVLLLAVALVFVITYAVQPQVFGFSRTVFHSWILERFHLFVRVER